MNGALGIIGDLQLYIPFTACGVLRGDSTDGLSVTLAVGMSNSRGLSGAVMRASQCSSVMVPAVTFVLRGNWSRLNSVGGRRPSLFYPPEKEGPQPGQ